MIKKMMFLAVAIIGISTFAGCAEQQKKIDDLTLAKQDLEGQLQQQKGDLDALQAKLANCEDSLAAARGQQKNLQGQLESYKRQPQLPAGWEVKKGMIMTSLPEAVLFPSGKAELLSSGTSKLDKVLSQIKSNFPGREVYIIGHTDSQRIQRSNWKDNLELSLHRSATVTRYMISRGLGAKQVIAAGAGEFRPVASNTTAQGKAQNRRVEFWILKPM